MTQSRVEQVGTNALVIRGAVGADLSSRLALALYNLDEPRLVDLAHCSAIDESAVSVLLAAASEPGCSLVVTGASAEVRQTLAHYNADGLLSEPDTDP